MIQKLQVTLAMVLLLSLKGHAQSVTADEFRKVFNAVSGAYSIEHYQLVFEQEIFLRTSDSKPFYTSRGKFLRGKASQYRTESPGQLTIQDEKIKMVIDSANKLVLLFKPDTLYSPMVLSDPGNSPLWSAATYRSERSGELQRYTVAFNNEGYEYRSIEYVVNPKTNRLHELVMYLQPGDYYSEENGVSGQESPRIVIRYVSPSGKVTGKEFQVEAFLTEKNGKYVLTEHMKGFVLDDLRYQ